MVSRVVVCRRRVAAAATTDLPYELPHELPHAPVGAAADKGSEQEDKGSSAGAPGLRLLPLERLPFVRLRLPAIDGRPCLRRPAVATVTGAACIIEHIHVADVAAVYGLIGVVSGALLAALGTLSVPLLQNRKADREWRRSRAEAEFHRLMDLRKRTREVVEFVEEATFAVMGSFPGTIDVRQVEDTVKSAMKAVQEAADNLAIDGMYFRGHLTSPEWRRGERPPHEADALLGFTQHVSHWTDLHRAAVDSQLLDDSNELLRQRRVVGQCRNDFVAHLVDAMDALLEGDLA